jgi:HEAT repeat protein
MPALVLVDQDVAGWCSQLVEDPDLLGRRAAAEMLGLLAATRDEPDGSSGAARDGEKGDDGERHALGLGDENEDRSVRTLAWAILADPSFLVRQTAAAWLDRFDPDLAGPALECALQDPDARVRTAAATSLGTLEAPEQAFTVLLDRAALEEVPEVRSAILGAMARLPLDEVDDMLEAMLERESTEVSLKATALGGLAERHLEAALPRAEKLCGPGEPRALREAAITVLGKASPDHPEARRALEALLEDSSLATRYAAVAALEGCTDPAVLPVLIRAFDRAPADDLRSQIRDLIVDVLSEHGLLDGER